MSRPTIKAIGPAQVADEGLTLAVPIVLSRRAQRRRMAPTPAGEATANEATALQLALARAHRWLRMLDSGEAASILDIAQREGEDRSYVGRMLNLTLLAPDIVAAILDDTLPESLRLHDLAINPPMGWDEQRASLAPCCRSISPLQ